MRRLAIVLLALAAGAASGCGAETADLLVVERSGSLPDAKLKLLITDGLSVECDGVSKPLENDRLLEARELTRDLLPVLDRNPRLPVPRTALLRFHVTGETGEATFADASPNLPPELGKLVRLTRRIAMSSCGKQR